MEHTSFGEKSLKILMESLYYLRLIEIINLIRHFDHFGSFSIEDFTSFREEEELWIENKYFLIISIHVLWIFF